MKSYHLNEAHFVNGNLSATAEWIESLNPLNTQRVDVIKEALKEKFINDRMMVIESQSLGIEIKEIAMGSGGVGQVKITKKGEIRIQIGCGYSRHNYAQTAIFNS